MSSSSPSGSSRFSFVEDSAPSKARSHAMREYWKQRHRRQQKTTSGLGRKLRNLLPRYQQNEGVSSRPDNTAEDELSTGQQAQAVPCDRNELSIAVQLSTNLRNALLISRPDPFQTCPIHLTSQHQKLLHHWICTHAAMMFDDLDAPTFNPMREVWFPLDISNASSFNCIMAHSAAHLAHLYAGSPARRGTNSSDALRYKAEAVKILRSWMSDPKKELSDDTFAAVVRLLSFERYWGSDAEWEVHRDGLQKMIEARGGIVALQNNWRLELVVYLASLMSRPSWLESTNKVEEISCPRRERPTSQLPLLPNSDLQKVRCLWLISFIQDMRTFMGYFCGAGLPPFPLLHTAIKFLCNYYQILMRNSPSDQNILGLEYEILACLLTVSIILQESIPLECVDTHWKPGAQNVLEFLERTLEESQDAWAGSIHILQAILNKSLRTLSINGDAKISYIKEMVKVLGTLSNEARHGVGECLLNLLKSSSKSGLLILIDDGWTPDSLLSSVHGH